MAKKESNVKKLESINVAIPNTSKKKMKAILALSHAIENVSKALISVQVDVTVSNNIIETSGNGTGITIDLE